MQDGYENRNDAFAGGVSAPASLLTEAQRVNSMIPRRFQPNGVNQQVAFSGIGSAEPDKQRQLLGGSPVSSGLPTRNGYGTDTYDAKRPFLSTDISSGVA